MRCSPRASNGPNHLGCVPSSELSGPVVDGIRALNVVGLSTCSAVSKPAHPVRRDAIRDSSVRIELAGLFSCLFLKEGQSESNSAETLVVDSLRYGLRSNMEVRDLGGAHFIPTVEVYLAIGVAGSAWRCVCRGTWTL